MDEALKRAYASRSDFQAALADVRAAEYSRKAATAGHYPTVSFTADYGVAGQHFNSSHGVFDVRGTLTIPIFAGGAVRGDVLQADAQLQQSRDRLENVRAQIDADIRVALLNLESASQQVTVAQSNIDLAEQSLTQSRDRFAAGVTDTVEVVQARRSCRNRAPELHFQPLLLQLRQNLAGPRHGSGRSGRQGILQRKIRWHREPKSKRLRVGPRKIRLFPKPIPPRRRRLASAGVFSLAAVCPRYFDHCDRGAAGRRIFRVSIFLQL